jgi:hypothetical protein
VYITNEDDPGMQALVPVVRIEKTKRRRDDLKNGHGTLKIAEPVIVPMLIDRKIEEAFVAIRNRKSRALVTVIEVMSPTNKIRGSEGRRSFLRKKQEVLASDVNWVEIDLLRSGQHSTVNPSKIPCDYRVVVSRADDRYHARYWPIQLRQQLPIVGIPLRGNDAEAPLDLAAALVAAYEIGAYDATIDYSKPATPPLSSADARWARQRIRERGAG